MNLSIYEVVIYKWRIYKLWLNIDFFFCMVIGISFWIKIKNVFLEIYINKFSIYIKFIWYYIYKYCIICFFLKFWFGVKKNIYYKIYFYIKLWNFVLKKNYVEI